MTDLSAIFKRLEKEDLTISETDNSFVVERFKPSDAWELVKAVYAIYGDKYHVDTFYDPEKLVRENENGNLFSFIAKTPSGKVIGHAALYRSSPPNFRLYEMGQFFVRKEFRNTRAIFKLTFLIKDTLNDLDIDGFFGEAVTHHMATQKLSHVVGALDTALELNLMPGFIYAGEKDLKGRTSTLLSFNVFKKTKEDLYFPKAFHHAVSTAIQKLKLERNLYVPENGKLPDIQTEVKDEIFKSVGVSRLAIVKTGSDIFSVLEKFEEKANAEGIEVRQIFFNATERNSQCVFDMLEKNNYFFAGYLPVWTFSDALLFQKLQTKPTYDNLLLHSAEAQEAFELIKAQCDSIWDAK